METRQTLFKIHWKKGLTGPPFYYQNFPYPEFATGLLSIPSLTLINASTWYLWSWKLLATERFLTNFAKNWKGFLGSVNAKASKLSGKITFLW